MVIYYYELKRGQQHPKYLLYSVDKKRFYLGENYQGPLHLLYRADQIWEWNTEIDSVRSFKMCSDGLADDIEVDPKEFLMIQLAAKDANNKTMKLS